MEQRWAAHRKLLIVDDMPAVRFLLRGIARSVGFEISEAWNGTQAIELFKTASPDIVLLDYKLPDRDGLTVLKELRTDLMSMVSVIMVTASDQRHTVETAMASGASGYIVKPFTPKRVLAELHRCLAVGAHEVPTELVPVFSAG